MNILYGAYAILAGGLFLSSLPAFWMYTRMSGRYREGLNERLGQLSSSLVQTLPGSPRIWVHAVSLGEIKVADPIIRAILRKMPGCSVLLSTTTESGRNHATEIFGERIPVVYAPVDFIGSVRMALHRVQPDVMVFLETEIWPAWLTEARRMGIKTALINGRISVRSIKWYMKFRPFFSEVLKNVDAFSMIMEEDAARIRAMGAEPSKIEVNGNAKYDLLTDLTEPETEQKMRHILNLKPSQPVFVAGSTHRGEEAILLDAYERISRECPDTVFIIVPRHIERTPEIASLVARRGLGYQVRSELDGDLAKRTEKIVILNSFGELFKLYSVGTIVFCGASLVPLGGQNPLEPAIWGRVVFYGPSMDDFLDAKELLEENHGGFEVSSAEMIAQKAIRFLKDPDALKTHGDRARKAVMKNRHAAEKHAKVIAKLFEGP